MSFLELLKGFWAAEQKQWTLERIKPPANFTQEEHAIPYATPLEAHKAYLTLWMRSMSIDATRVAWNRFHAVLHAECQLVVRGQEKMVIPTVLSPGFLQGLDAARLHNVLHINRTIFGPAAYAGGPFGVECGVFAVKHADLAQPFLTMLDTLAGAAGVALIGAAKPFVDPIKSGVELLTGTRDATSLQIALLRQFQPPETGWYALVKFPAGELKASDLSVRNDNLELLHKGEKVTRPYLVFSIDGSTTRPDWGEIPELKAAYADFQGANTINDAKSALAVFRRRAIGSSELLRTHAKDLVKAVETELEDMFAGGGVAKHRAATTTSRQLSDVRVQFNAPE